ncbi:MAG: hypothetical protein KGM96_07235 [Acidobacteriota bacterium]|nr:hypothetical protein [Acidobacteriota bacterium]
MASSLLKPVPLRAWARLCPLDAPASLRLWHLASLDAPTVAVAWALAFAWAAGVRLPAWVPVLLALGTWTVYISDRLLDARSSLRSGALHRLRERHFFHWRHRRVLLPVAVIAGAAAAAIIFILMPVVIRERNSVLGVAALAYFSGVHSRRRAPSWLGPALSKEFLVGVLFTAGCALPTLTRMRLASAPGAAIWLMLAPVAFFAALAWLNCHAIERWESGRHAARIFTAAGLLACIGLLLATVFASIEPRAAALLAAGAASALLLALLDRARDRLTPLALRAAADLVLLTPFVLVLR